MTLRINHADSNHPFSYFIPKEPDNLANWADGEWATADGKYRVHVGGSSADTPLEKNVPLNFKLSKDKRKRETDKSHTIDHWPRDGSDSVGSSDIPKIVSPRAR